MKRTYVASVAVLLVLAVGCGDDDSGSDGTAADDGAGSGGGGDVVAPAAGQAVAQVDGQEFQFSEPGAAPCMIADDSITYSYQIGDNDVVLNAGIIGADGGWAGSIALTVTNPGAEPGPIAYYPAPGAEGMLDGSLITVDGSTITYRGPMLKQPANDGTQPPPVDIGIGTISATCQ